MKKKILYKLTILAAIPVIMASCNDFDPEKVDYVTGEGKESLPVNPVDIDPSWELELITNIGQHDRNVFVYKDKKYDNFFTRSLGWNGGDGVQTTLLPDDNAFWSFNDSFYGVVEEPGRIRRSNNFPRNTIMVQTGESSDDDFVWLVDYIQTTDPNADCYYQAYTHLRHPWGEKTQAELDKGESDQHYLYWAGDATVYNDPVRGNIMQMLWGAVDNTNSNNYMRWFGTALAEYSLVGKPGDPDYLKLISIDHDLFNNSSGYGSSLFEDKDGHTYLYCDYGFDSNWVYNILVARTETHDLRSEWSYYIRGLDGEFQWQTTYPTDDEKQRSTIQDGNYMTTPWVFEKNGKYYLIGQQQFFGHNIYISEGDTPYGPFTNQKVLFAVPYTLDKLGEQYYNNLYMVNLHPHLSRTGELVFSTNTDCSNFWDNYNRVGSADFYRPYFFRVFNWESLFQEDAEEEE